MSARRDHELAWWLGGEETCRICLQVFAYEVGMRCSHCDGDLCPHCVIEIRETMEVLCPGCAPGIDEPSSEGS